jgi:hypothetical protein
LAGLAFAWGGPFVSLIETGQCAAPAFLPWICAAGAWIGQAKAGERSKPAAVAAIAAALIFLSGTPEIGACALGLALVLAAACSERLDLLGVRSGIEFGHGAPVYAPLGFAPALRALDGELRVCRNPSPRQKARLVSAVLAGPDAAGIAPRCAGREAVWLSPADAAKLPAGLRAAGSCAQLPSEGASGHARLLRYEPERVLVETVAPAPALLLLADTWDPGWSAHIDGAPADSLAADGALRAVAVPAGRHRVEWTYRTPGLRQGALLSALSLCVLTGLLFVGRRPTG